MISSFWKKEVVLAIAFSVVGAGMVTTTTNDIGSTNNSPIQSSWLDGWWNDE